MGTITQIEAGQHVKDSYMPYAMSTILDRALPDVRDGLKPIHRRILFAMYKAGIVYNRYRAKTREPISETMKIHNHGDVSIADAIALMTEQNESLLHPYIDGEGAFGKIYSKDSPSDPRYTFCRLNRFSEEYFKDIKNNIIPMIGEDKDHLQPLVLSSGFPSILIKNNIGIACGEACEWGSFNLIEVCNTTIAYIKDKDITLLDYLKAPDFSSAAYLLYNKSSLETIYNTGKGSIILKAKYTSTEKCIEIHEIPYNTTVDAIVLKISELMKSDKYKMIMDVRDETGFNEVSQREEMMIAIDIKKNTNVEVLMANLFVSTTLQCSQSFNMNCLVDYEPKVLGIKQILNEWLLFRRDCVTKTYEYNINKKSEQLHLLQGLEKVLLDINKTIQIIRQSKNDDLVVSNLIKEFDVDEIQSNEIANIKLRNLNKEYILNKIKLIKTLTKEIKELKLAISNEDKINDIIITELERIRDTYGRPRLTEILYESQVTAVKPQELIDSSAITMILTKGQYIKKTLKYADISKQTVKENDIVTQIIQTNNSRDLLLFTNQGHVYTRKIYELSGRVCCQPSSQGEYIPNILTDLQPNEKVIYIVSPESYSTGYMLYTFQDSNILKMSISPYYNKQNRQVAQDAYLYSPTNPLRYIRYITNDIDILAFTSEGKALIVNTSQINAKTSNGGKKSLGNPFIKLESSKFDNNEVVEVIFEPTIESNFTIATEKKDFQFDLGLSDIAENGKIYWDYLQGKRMNSGLMIYNCRQKKNRIISIKPTIPKEN